MTEHSRKICHPSLKEQVSSLKRIDLLCIILKKRVMGGRVTHSEIRKLYCKCTTLEYKSEVFSVCLCAYQFQNSLPDFNKTQCGKFHKSFGRFSFTVIH